MKIKCEALHFVTMMYLTKSQYQSNSNTNFFKEASLQLK